MKISNFVCLILLGTALGLAACGKKPSDVDPPIGASPSDYPGTYPDITTDPR
jgi:hypothetical protein